MGDVESKEAVEHADDHLDINPSFLQEYLNRNPSFLDEYVESHVDQPRILRWLKTKVHSPQENLLQLSHIDYLKPINCPRHHTDRYSHNCLVVRRGGVIDLDIHFSNRSFQDKDNVSLEFGVGQEPNVTNGTSFPVSFGSSLQPGKWSGKLIQKDDDKKISVQVNIPPDAIIGRYKLTVEVTSQLPEGPKVERKTKPDVIVIFNPFSEADEVYMEDEKRRQEYVLNDTGIIYYGQHYRIGGMDWLFGQYEPGILDIALKLLREAPNVRKNPVKSVKKRASPVYCSRILSAMVNSNDDNGVLYGRWDGKYDDGKSPTSWNGSVKILRQWNKNNMKEVKYGQCWVFSGVLTTVLRALGIPARSVTNFQSAHDTEFNMTIDRFIDDEGEESDAMSSGDSIWNFHVWNEGWFRRSDLPDGYDGWQAVDSTPQEESGGVYRCGPSPVKAVKHGDIFIGMDTNFIFAEVNADRLTWRVNEKGEVENLVRRETRHVGQKISTKAVGSREREDITREYKYPENSDKEREAFARAYAFAKKPEYHEALNVIRVEGDVTIDISEVGEPINGETIAFQVKIRNATDVNKTAITTTAINTMLHNGERKTLLMKERIEVYLKPRIEKEQVFEIPFATYGRHLADNNVVRICTTVRVKETNHLYVDQYDAQVMNPNCLVIECDDIMKLGRDADVTFILYNPLPVPLTGGVFSIESNGIRVDEDEFKISDPIAPYAAFKTRSVSIRPFRVGEATLVAEFDCNEIVNLTATKNVIVRN